MSMRDITSSTFSRKTDIQKDSTFDVKFKKSIKEFSSSLKTIFAASLNKIISNVKQKSNESSSLSSISLKYGSLTILQRTKITEYIKTHFQDKFNKFEIKYFFVYLTREFYKQLHSLLTNFSQFDVSNKEKVIAFLLSFYDFYEDELVISNPVIVKTVTSSEIGDSYLTALNNILLLSFSFDIFPLIFLKENNVFDIGIVIIQLIYIFHKIINSALSKDDGETREFIEKGTKYSLPKLIEYLVAVLSYQDKTTLMIIIERDDLCFFFNELPNFNEIRRSIYFLLLKGKSLLDEDEKIQFTTYIEENKCLEGILTSIKNSSLRQEYDDLEYILQEITNVLIIHFSFCNKLNESNDIFQLLLVIFDDIANSKCDIEALSSFLCDFLNFTFLDNDELKNKFKEKEKSSDLINIKDITSMSSSSNNIFPSSYNNKIKNNNVIDFFLDLFEMNDSLRKTIANMILNKFTNDLPNYKLLVSDTAFCEKFISNLYQCNEEIISYFFLFLFSFSEGNAVYSPIKEVNTIIASLNKCKEYPSLFVLVKNLKTYIEMKCDQANIQELARTFFNEFSGIIKDVINPRTNPFNCKEERLYNQEMLLLLVEVVQILIDTHNRIFTQFKELKFITFFTQLVAKYTIVGYKICNLLIDYEKEECEISYLANFLSERYESITSNAVITLEIINEFNCLVDCLKVFFHKEKKLSHSNKKKIIQMITSLPIILTKKNESLLAAWNSLTQLALKQYLGYVLDFIKLTNKIILNKEKKDCLIIDYASFKGVIISIIQLFSDLKEKEYLIDIIKYLIDKSFNFKLSEGIKSQKIAESNEKLIKNDFTVFYINKYIISTSTLNNSYSTISNHSNFALQSPLLQILTLKSLFKIGKYVDVFLCFIEFTCKLNENNSKLLLKASLLKTLLKISSVNEDYLPLISNIFDIITRFFSQTDLKVLFEYILIHFNSNPSEKRASFINRLVSIVYKSLNDSFKYKKSIVLSYFNTRQPNMYNMIYTSGVKLHPSSRVVSIFISLKFYASLDNTKFTLMKFEKETKDGKESNSFEVSIENVNLIIKENEAQIFSSNELTRQLFIGKQTEFLIEMNKEIGMVSLSINNKLFIVCPSKFIDQSLSHNANYSFMTGYTGSSLKESYDDKFITFPHVSLSYCLIYLDKLTLEMIDIMQLLKVTTSKMGSIKSDHKEIRYLSVKGYQRISPTQDETRITVPLQIDIDKISYELIVDSVALLCKSRLGSLSTANDHWPIANFLNKIEIKNGIPLASKVYLEYIPQTNNMTYSNIYCNTYLLSKYDISDSLCLNWIYQHEGVMNQMINRLIFTDKLIDIEINCLRILKFLILLLNEVSQIKFEAVRKDIVNSIINLLSFYLVTNLPELNKFCTDGVYFKSLLMALIKNAFDISKEGIDMLFYLSYAFDGKRKKEINQLYNPWYTKIITNLLLNMSLFNELSLEVKAYLLSLIKIYIVANDFTMGNYSLSLSLFDRLLSILLMCKSDKEIDGEITTIILSLVDQVLKIKKGIQSPSQDQTNRAVKLLSNFISVTNRFEANVKEHIDKKSKGKKSISYEILNDFFMKIYSGSIMFFREKIIARLNQINLSATIKAELFKDLPLLTQAELSHTLSANKKKPNAYSNSIVISESNLTEEDNKNNNKDDSNLPKSTRNFNDNKICESNLSQKNSNSLVRKEKKTLTQTTPKYKPALSMNTFQPTQDKEKDSWAIISPVNQILMQNTIHYEVNDQEICFGHCCLCNFIRNVMKKEYLLLKTHIEYKHLITSMFNDLFIMNRRKEDYLRERLGLSFSWYLDLKEGPSRMRKRLKCRLDNLLNEDIDRSQQKEANGVNSGLNQSHKQYQLPLINKFSFYDINSKLNSLLALDQIFDIGIVKEFIDYNDVYDSAYNCLMFKGMAYINSVMILGKTKIYILNSLNIDQGDVLYSVIKAFKRIFWTLNEYNEMVADQCRYLNAFKDTANTNSNQNNGNALNNKDVIEEVEVEVEEEEDKANSNKFTLKDKELKIYTFSYDEINEIYKRRFLHQENAIEIFLNNGKTFLLSFNSNKRDAICNKILNNFFDNSALRKRALSSKNSNSELLLPVQASNFNWKHSSMIFIRNSNLFMGKHKGKRKKNDKTLLDIKSLIEECQDKWSQGFLSNFSYLMILNTLSGRSYNDLALYPVYPWILRDYTNETINLIKETTYRNFFYPIYAQEEAGRKMLQIKYESTEGDEGKYHSGSHYSNPGFTAYYLVRIKPFSNIAAEIQGGCFDISDRLFCNIKSLYSINNKYQELIPEMFDLPELLVNFNDFKYGINQSNEIVNDVLLPQWARNDPRLFSKMTKKAMESAYVSQKINDWIDLIFGYKQKGNEAIESLNVLRNVCTSFDPNGLIQEKSNELLSNSNSPSLTIEEQEQIIEEVELKINEICDMGQNPMQLFTKSHPKKERHQKIIAFFSRSVYLMNFKPKEKEYKIKIDTNPNDFRSYYEISNQYLSHGEGGLSSFRMFFDPSSSSDNHTNTDTYQHIYFIVGSKRTLLAPSYKNYIDYSRHKYSFSIVKPYSKISFEFPTHSPSPITIIKATNDGKHILIAFQDGCLRKYKLKKLNELINPPDSDKKKDSKNFIVKVFKKDNNKENKNNSFISNGSNNTSKVITHNAIDSKINISTSNIAHLDTFFSVNQHFIQYSPFSKTYSSIEFKDYHTHAKTKSQHDLKQMIKAKEKKPIKAINILLVNTTSIINHPIVLMELCECYSMMLVVDINNFAYLLDLNSFEAIRHIDVNKITKSRKRIKYISICPFTGDFILATSYQAVYFNFNGVVLAILDIRSEEAGASHVKITSCLLKSLQCTESDSYLFTGHNDGCVSIWKIENSYDKDIDSYRFAYNRKYYNETIQRTANETKPFNLQLKFDILIKIKCSNSALLFIKITEDLTKLLVINKDYSLIYLSYEDFLEKKKKSKQLKTCPQCSSPIGSSKILCQLCNKKLCSSCKMEAKIPEFSLKTPKPICEDCLAMITSTNKMLYDF